MCSKLSKCSIGVRSVADLGHKVATAGVVTSDGHNLAMKAPEQPGSLEKLIRFFGLAYYFSRVFDHYEELYCPLHGVLKLTGFVTAWAQTSYFSQAGTIE